MPVGLDLGSHNFRAVELGLVKGKVILQKFGIYENSKISLDSESKDELMQYTAAIRHFFAEIGFSTDSVNTSLPETDVFTRVVKVPQMSEKELKSAIEFEAEQYIPLPLKEVNYDFQIIDSNISEKDKMDVLLVAAKHTVLDNYVNILKGANLTPRGLEPETLSITRSLGDSVNRPSGSIVVNTRSNSTQIIVIYKGFVRFTRSVPIGGESLTRGIAQKLGLEFAQAEEYKKTYGLESDQAEGKVHQAIKPVFDNILSEIKRSKVFYTTHNPNVMINKIVLCGGTALMPGLLFYVANNLDLEVELANPWRNIDFSPKLEKQRETLLDMGPVFVTAVGLALKDFRK